MAGVNKVILLGRLGKDPELRSLESGTKVCTFSIATSENYTDREGQKQERTEWHNIVLWAKLAELADSYLSKGREVYIEGKLQTRKWQDQTGNDRYTTEIVGTSMNFVGGRSDAPNSGGTPPPPSMNDAPVVSNTTPKTDAGNSAFDTSNDEDDLPF